MAVGMAGLWVAGNGLGWRPHTVKGPEIGHHPNPFPAGERCWDSSKGVSSPKGATNDKRSDSRSKEIQITRSIADIGAGRSTVNCMATFQSKGTRSRPKNSQSLF